MSTPTSAPGRGPALFAPLRLRGLELPNRIVVSPMCQYSAVDGCATDWHLIHLGQLAASGAGLLIVEATGVEPAGRISRACLSLHDDATEAALVRVLAGVRTVSAMPVALQLGHAGRKASSALPWEGARLVPPEAGGWRPVAPSPVPHGEGEPPPSALAEAELDSLVRRFAEATRRAARIGFHAVELHGAHGYLLHQFLSPLSNHRTDRFGGSLENRMRFPLAVFEAMRDAWPADRPLGIRVSATDWVEGGWDPAQTVVFGKALRALGCDWIDVSSGGVSPRQRIPLGPGYQVHLAERIRQEVGGTVMTVGQITDPAHAESIVASGRADLVALGRGMLYDPRWPWHAAASLGATVQAPRQYWRAPPREHESIFGRTSIGRR